MDDRVEVGQGQRSFWKTIFPIEIPGATVSEVTFRHSFFGGMKLLVDGVRAKRGEKRAISLIPTSDGGEFRVTLRPGYAGISPEIIAHTNTASIGRRIASAEWIWVGLPLLLPVYALFARGGAIDMAVGFLAFAANVRIFINDGLTVGQRYLYSLGAVGLLAVTYLAISAAIILLIL